MVAGSVGNSNEMERVLDMWLGEGRESKGDFFFPSEIENHHLNREHCVVNIRHLSVESYGLNELCEVRMRNRLSAKRL